MIQFYPFFLLSHPPVLCSAFLPDVFVSCSIALYCILMFHFDCFHQLQSSACVWYCFCRIYYNGSYGYFIYFDFAFGVKLFVPRNNLFRNSSRFHCLLSYFITKTSITSYICSQIFEMIYRFDSFGVDVQLVIYRFFMSLRVWPSWC